MAESQSPADLQRARQQRDERERAERGAEPAPGEAADEQPTDDEDVVTQLSIEGDADLGLAVGGKKPDKSVVLVAGGEISLDGQFAKGQRVRIVFEGPVAEVHLIDIRDSKTGDVTATKRKHVMKPDTIEKVALRNPDASSAAA